MIYGFWISLDYPHISVEETLTLIKAYGGHIKNYYRIGKLLLVDADIDIDIVKHIIYRSASIREGFRIYKVERNKDFVRTFSPDLFHDVKNSSSIAVKVLRHNSNLYSSIDSIELTRLISSKLLEDYKGKVDLSSPEKRFVFIFVEDATVSSLELVGRHSKGFDRRSPCKKPVFTPFSLVPKLARVMVNLSGAVEGELILDPFCGVGGISVETTLLGIENICIELSYRWTVGSLRNIMWIDKNRCFLEAICGDSTYSFIRDVKYVVTDPPYGRITSTGIYLEASHILRRFLNCLSNMEKLKRAVFMYPAEFKIDFDKYDLSEVNRFMIPVHSGLTRVLRVVERKR